jgi:hypothetical protein
MTKDTRTSAQWWAETKADPAKFNEWLLKQYRGEVTAAVRIVKLGEQFGITGKNAVTLGVIAGQEANHAQWVGELLKARGIELPTVEEAEERYWAKTLPGIESFESGSAVAAHAEEMRLERIRVIVADADAPIDVRAVFTRILREEVFHARAFREMSTDAAMAATLNAHEAGMAALGLTI